MNVFPKEPEIRAHTLKSDGPIRLFWFSQTIGPKRGLQDVTGAFKILDSSKYELHLLGNCTEEVKAEISAQAKSKIEFYGPIAAGELASFASQFDIGLALEPGFSINNNLALSNKIFTYLQAGLCVIASDTIAQKSLIDSYPAIGKVYPRGDLKVLSDILNHYDQDRNQLLKAQQAALFVAHEALNWETEQGKFLGVIENILQK